MPIFFYLLTFVVGMGTSVQSSINGALGQVIGKAEATFVSLMGSVFLIVLLMAFGFSSGRFGQITTVPPYLLIGGIFGMAYITTANMVVPVMGVAAFISMYVTGQLLGSVLLDQVGAFGNPTHPLDAFRIAGVVFLLIGMKLVIR